jgi:carbon-monoxide dehydrogenase medium subunit
LAYLKPATLTEALEMLERYSAEGAVPLAGGTDLVPAMRRGAVAGNYLLDLAGLGLDRIEELPGEIRLGALATFNSLLRSPIVQAGLPVLVQAASQIGAVQTRSLATIGGNLCSAVPSLDSAPALLVLGARLRLVSKQGERVVAIEDFFLGPSRTVRRADEILAGIMVPSPDRPCGTCFFKQGRRKALTLAVVNAACALWPNSRGEISEVRIALGAVAPVPLRARRAEALLTGQRPSGELFAQAAAAAAGETLPLSDLRASAAYRRALSEVLVRRALDSAWRQATGERGRGE